MATEFDLDNLDEGVIELLEERHLAIFSILRPDGGPQATPVGFTYDPRSGLARIITRASSYKARRLTTSADRRVSICQVDGRRWVSLYGEAAVSSDSARVAEAVDRYAQRYRIPGERPDRVVIEVDVERMVGHL